MSLATTLTAIDVTEGDLFALLTEIYGTKFTGMVILHCIDGVPKRAEFPSRQVTLCTKSARSA